MKLLILPRYGRLGASSRLRMMQYISHLEEAGFEVESAPFFDDEYVKNLYRGKSQLGPILGYYLSRVARLVAGGKPDLIWLEKELFPWLPMFVERQLFPRNVPVVTDYDDAVFHRYDLHSYQAIRYFLGPKIDQCMASSELVLAGNAYLATRAECAGAKRIEIVPTVVDIASYATRSLTSRDGKLRVGWIGTPTTWRQYMVPMIPMLMDLMSSLDGVLRVVGVNDERSVEPFLEFFPWKEDEESQLIQGMDVGLMPLDDSPWSRGKCGYKLIQYMACGLPVVASPIGVNSEIVEDGVTGFLASTESEWRNAVIRLLSDEGLRRRMGMAGRRRVEAHYSLQVWGARVAKLLSDVVPH